MFTRNTVPGIFDSAMTVLEQEDPVETHILQDKTDSIFKDLEQEKTCDRIVASLTDAEKETAARSSYKYFKACISGKETNEETRKAFASKMARRHLVAEKGDEERATQKMKAAIEYREKMQVDVIRTCFEKKNFKDEEEKELYEKYRTALDRELSEGKLFTRGHDKEKRALYIALTHKYLSYDHDWYMQYNIYTLERAIALTEEATNGAMEKIVAVFDFGHYTSKNQVPISLSKEISFCLRDNYPERVEKILMIDAPFVFRAFYKLVSIFIDADTREKIVFVTGEEEKAAKVGEFISKDQAMPGFLPGGELVEDLDMKKYLYEVPFDRA